MLYDQRWDAKTKADPFSLESLIAWLEKQPGAVAYDFMGCEGACLLDQYIEHVTGKPSTPSYLHWSICGGGNNYDRIGRRKPWTFGAALTRARAVLTERAGA